jgi:hypothetical protein
VGQRFRLNQGVVFSDTLNEGKYVLTGGEKMDWRLQLTRDEEELDRKSVV